MNTQTIQLTPPIDGVQYGYNSEEKKPADGWYFDFYINKVRNTSGAEYSYAEHCKNIICSTNPKDLRFPFLVMPSKEQEVGFNTNPAKYTQEDMILFGAAVSINSEIGKTKTVWEVLDEHLKSLQPTAKAVVVEREENNCDGCKAGIPIDEYNYHRMGKGIYPDFMICQKDKYNKIKVETSSEYPQGLIKALEVIY